MSLALWFPANHGSADHPSGPAAGWVAHCSLALAVPHLSSHSWTSIHPISKVSLLARVVSKPLGLQRPHSSKEGLCGVSHIAASHSDVAFGIESAWWTLSNAQESQD